MTARIVRLDSLPYLELTGDERAVTVGPLTEAELRGIGADALEVADALELERRAHRA